MKQKVAAVLASLTGLLIAAILLLTAPATPARSASAPVLLDQVGKPFTMRTLEGRPLAVTFVAAHCTDACPLINAQFEHAQRLLAQEHLDARLLTVTLDPEHDPPVVMRELARRFNADPRRWILASGTIRGVHALMNLFGVAAQRGRAGYADVHTTFVYILDKRGRLRKTMLASTMLGTQVADDLRGLAQ